MVDPAEIINRQTILPIWKDCPFRGLVPDRLEVRRGTVPFHGQFMDLFSVGYPDVGPWADTTFHEEWLGMEPAALRTNILEPMIQFLDKRRVADG